MLFLSIDAATECQGQQSDDFTSVYGNYTQLYCLYTDDVDGDNKPECIEVFSQFPELLGRIPSLGRKWITAFYWSLTIIMKSPWLAPTHTSAQVYSAFIIVFGVMIFSIFIGTVTAMINSYDKNNRIFRERKAMLQAYFLSKGLAPSTRRAAALPADQRELA